MTISKLKIIYEWILWIIGVGLLVTWIVLLIYYNGNAWIGSTVVFIVWFLVSVLVCFVIFNSSRTINNKLCWIVCIMCIPLIGLIIFCSFGIFPFKKNKLKEYSHLSTRFYTKEDYTFSKLFINSNHTDKSIRKAFYYGLSIHKPITKCNQFTLLDNVDELYIAILSAIKQAKKFINIQTYIVKKSIFFDVLAKMLIEKAKEGVVINFMYDWVGGLFNNPKNTLKLMKTHGINIATFNTFRFNPFSGQTNYRSHRKCIIVDNKVAIYGGSNISDDYFNLVQTNNYWKDINVKVEGEIVNSLNVVFANDWSQYTLNSINNEIKQQFINNKEFYFPKYDFSSLIKQDNICQFVESSPLLYENTIHDIILNLIGSANERIWITTPYFYPSDDIINQLVAAAYAGIDVKIIVPGNVDNKKYILLINRFNYKRLFDAGIKVYEYYGFMHGKELIIDHKLTLMGTFNFDYRSLYSNFETALLIDNREWNKTVTNEYHNLISTSKQVNESIWISTQTFWNKFKVYCMNLIHPLF